jgi:hypothetical protein
MTIRLILACDGAAYFDDGSPDYGTFNCGNAFPKERSDHSDQAELLRAARKNGWRIGPQGDAMCPSCAAPDPATLRFIEQMGAKQRSAA